MCGLAGLFDLGRSLDPARLEILARAMADTLVHRGPDDGATWADMDAGIAFGFRRLAIVDLSLDGRQPMRSHDGRYVIVMNGEIYNFREMRAALDAASAPAWRGHSDTEVLLEFVARKGLDAALAAANGMFAFALWDSKTRALTLARDRLGKKPLYYGRVGGAIAFASELKALRVLPGFDAAIDPQAMALFLRHAYVPSPLSIHRTIRKLRPGEIAKVSADAPEPATRLYWDARKVAEAHAEAPFDGSEADAVERLDALVQDAVATRMIADVPLGAFLSGGIDSSTVVAAMVAAKLGPVRTFTVGFAGTRYDEAPYAAAVAKHLGTLHAEMQAGEAECLELVPRLAHMYDEPFADASQIPTAVLSRLTRKHVTVALSGDGGDELFGGYPRYRSAAGEWDARVSPALAPAMRAAARVAGALDAKTGRALARRAAATPERLYADHVSLWHAEDRLMADAWPEPVALFALRGAPRLASPVRRFMTLDALTYLPDDLLAKVDRASMAYSLEVRCPLLDYRIVEFAWSLPDWASFGADGTKRALRQVLARRVPRALFERPKSGFEPPVGDWLRGPLRDWAEDLLAPAALEAAGLNPAPVRARWARHLGGRNATYPLWTILMFQAWRRAG